MLLENTQETVIVLMRPHMVRATPDPRSDGWLGASIENQSIAAHMRAAVEEYNRRNFAGSFRAQSTL